MHSKDKQNITATPYIHPCIPKTELPPKDSKKKTQKGGYDQESMTLWKITWKGKRRDEYTHSQD
jgi:hypothetical protein